MTEAEMNQKVVNLETKNKELKDQAREDRNTAKEKTKQEHEATKALSVANARNKSLEADLKKESSRAQELFIQVTDLTNKVSRLEVGKNSKKKAPKKASKKTTKKKVTKKAGGGDS